MAVPASEQKISTRVTEMFGIETPILLAGMGGISHKELVSAVSRAGGLGVLGSATMVRHGPEALRDQLREVREAVGGRPFGVDILVPGSGDSGVMDLVADIIIESGATCFVSGLGFPKPEVVRKFRSAGVHVGAVGGKVSHCVRAVEAGCSFVIVQGTQAGGHTGQIALNVLLPQVVDAVGGRVPVLAAGGIYDGRGMAAALAMGADGVWVGTRFLMSDEANTVSGYKEALVRASSSDTVITKSYTGRTVRALANDWTRHHEEHPEDIKPPGLAVLHAVKSGALHLGCGPDQPGIDPRKEAYLTGQAAGAIKSIEPAAKIVRDMTTGCIAALAHARNFTISGGARSRL